MQCYVDAHGVCNRVGIERKNEGDKMLERKRKLEVPKEENFTCKKCGKTTMKMADNRDDAIIKKVNIYYDEKQGKILCTCGHWLGEQEELYNYPEITEIQQYGFWLRFLSEHFIPCVNCQGKIHKLVVSKEMHIGSEDKPPVELWRRWEIISVVKKPNSVFVKEKCVVCGNWFDADDNFIYDCQEFHGYACYDCGKRIENK